MSFRDYDKKTYIVDTAKDFANRRISKRAFLKKMGMAGIGFSAFNVALLGNMRRDRGFTLGQEALAQDAEVNKWLKDVSGPFKGAKIRYTSEATPPTVVLDKLKGEFTDATGIEVEIEIVPLFEPPLADRPYLVDRGALLGRRRSDESERSQKFERTVMRGR